MWSILILEDGEVYTIEGLRVKTPTKRGIYIQNGKKKLFNK